MNITCFQEEFIRGYQAIQRGSQSKAQMRNETTGDFSPRENLPLQAVLRVAEGKAEETKIERQAAHNVALACYGADKQLKPDVEVTREGLNIGKHQKRMKGF